jgi:hypothetical protein
VGVVEGGWHCGGNPATSGGAESASVQITNSDPQELVKDKTLTLTAVGSPAGGEFFWSANNSVISFVGPTNASSVEIKGNRTGVARVRVRYRCASGAEAEAEITVKVKTKDVTVIAWVDGGPPAAAQAALESEANFLLKFRLSNRITCSTTSLDWLVGIRFPVISDADRRYANAFLLANSPNNSPGGTIDPAAAAAAGDYRLFQRYQVLIDDSSGTPQVTTFQSVARVGDTPNPCRTIPSASSPEAHASNGSGGLTSSLSGAYQLNQGRLGSLGQRINDTLNGHSTPWIWSVIRFDLQGTLSPNPVDHSIFPTFYVYEDGQLVGPFPQSDAETFIALDDTYQRLPSQIP